MNLQIVNPVENSEWDDLLLKSGDHSFFHTSGWARVLAESYRYTPVYLTAFENVRLSLLMPFMEISSRLTGKRGVSLPFTDHCDPFVLDQETLPDAVKYMIHIGKQRDWNYVEWRIAGDFITGAVVAESHVTHNLDLGRTESELFSGLRESNRRNIRKAAKAGVTVRFEHSPEALRVFYRLHCRTRRRHGLPPQPLSFFQHIREHVLTRGFGVIVSAMFLGQVIASSIFLHFGPVAIFKYGSSDTGFLAHRPNNLVLWEAARWYKARGAKSLSLGRTDTNNPGLLRFKRSWGATECALRFYRYDLRRDVFSQSSSHSVRPHALLSKVPLSALRLMGRALYRHIG